MLKRHSRSGHGSPKSSYTSTVIRSMVRSGAERRSFHRSTRQSQLERKEEEKQQLEIAALDRQIIIEETLAGNKAAFKAEQNGEDQDKARRHAVDEVRKKFGVKTAAEKEQKQREKQERRLAKKAEKEEEAFRIGLDQSRTASMKQQAKNKELGLSMSPKSSIRRMKRSTEKSNEQIKEKIASTKTMLRQVEDKHQQNHLKLTLASDAMKGAKDVIAQTVLMKMKETLNKRRKDEECLSKWQRKWRWAARRALALHEVEQIREMLRNRGYPPSYWDDVENLLDAKSACISESKSCPDSISTLSKEVNTKQTTSKTTPAQLPSLSTARPAANRKRLSADDIAT